VPVAAEWGTGQVFLSFLWFFLFFIWIWLLIVVFSDIFRSHDLSGWAKALWIIFVVILPYLGVFVYLIARGRHMQEHAVADAKQRDSDFRQYVQSAAERVAVARPTRSLDWPTSATRASSPTPSSSRPRPKRWADRIWHWRVPGHPGAAIRVRSPRPSRRGPQPRGRGRAAPLRCDARRRSNRRRLDSRWEVHVGAVMLRVVDIGPPAGDCLAPGIEAHTFDAVYVRVAE